jgi:hypothetical protein
MTSSCLSAATSPAISSRIAHESLLHFSTPPVPFAPTARRRRGAPFLRTLLAKSHPYPPPLSRPPPSSSPLFSAAVRAVWTAKRAATRESTESRSRAPRVAGSTMWSLNNNLPSFDETHS